MEVITTATTAPAPIISAKVTPSPPSSPAPAPAPDTPMTLSNYSEKSIKISGTQAKKYTNALKELGGKFNSALQGGPGWIFSKKNEENVKQFLVDVEAGKIQPQPPSPKYPARSSSSSPSTTAPAPAPAPAPETPMTLSDYSEKAIKISGTQAKRYSETLKEMGGKFNPMLQGGPGWIFSKKQDAKIKLFLADVKAGKIQPQPVSPTASAPKRY